MPREFALELVELKPEPRDRGKTVAQILAAEARADRARACRARAWSRWTSAAQPWTTRELAEQLARWRDDARDVAFVIGSADGLDAALKRDAACHRRAFRANIAARARARHARRAAVPRGEPPRAAIPTIVSDADAPPSRRTAS